jgi:hypothetical protein
MKRFFDKYFPKKIRGKTLEDDPSVIEKILGVPIILEEISGAWEERGIFIKENEDYTFLSRDYFEPEKDGRGNIILSRGVSTKSILIDKGQFNYVIKFGFGGGGCGIFDEFYPNIPPEKDFWGLKKGWLLYDKLLDISGIYKVRKVN